jgi:ABC-type multidrug transport system fused ATPase/permease subunit
MVQLSTLLAVCIFLFLFLAFRTGLVRGLQDTIADQAWGRAQFSIGAAISSMKHGGYGYASYSGIKTILEYAGVSGDPAVLTTLGLTFPENLRNPFLINRAINKAVEFKAPFNPDREVYGSGGEDVGLVDFVRLSFFLFGFGVVSFYLTYFTLLGLSLLCAVAAFRKQPGFLAVFFVTALALPMIFASSIFDLGVNGILDPRFLSMLGIIPSLHIALAVLSRAELSVANATFVAVQSCILVLAYWIRSTAFWMVLALLILVLVLAARSLRNHRPKDLRRLWPAGILGALAVVHFVGVTLALHPIYETANERPHHGLWHPMLYALEVHPQWKTKYAAKFDGATGDDLPETMAKKYLLRHPPTDPEAVYLTADRKYIRAGVTETYKKKAFLEFLASDPRHVLEAFFIHNVRLCKKALSYHLSSLKKLLTISKFGVVAMVFLLAGLFLRDASERPRFLYGMLICTGAFVLSFPYLMLTAPGYAVVVDQFLLLLSLIAGWGAMALTLAARWTGP